MKNRIKGFLKSNLIVFIYALIVVFTELVSICFVGCSPILTNELYAISLFGIVICSLMLIKNTKVKAVLCCVLLLAQIVINVGFVYLFDSNGTYFEWAMINQRNDAFGTIEDLSLRWGLVALLISVFAVFVVGSVLLIKFSCKKKVKNKLSKSTKILLSSVLTACTLFVVLNPTVNAVQASKMSYIERYLYSDATNKYQKLGITSNAVYELVNGTLVNSLVDYNTKGVEEFIYEDEEPYCYTSEYFGISQNNNLVYILVESFEWYVFLQNCTPEQSALLYPNLNKFLSESIYADSFYAREKTDTSEMLATMGSNPTGKYINYDFPTNTYSWSLPNMFKQHVENNGNELVHVKSFHQNDGSFYNRNTLHQSMGYDELVDIIDMEELGMVNTWNEEAFKGERNLDSETVQTLQYEMFPDTDPNEQYMSFWITFAMHGYYEERETFKAQGYYDKLDEVGAYPKGISKKDDYLRTYAAAVMDFDKAVGIMMERLRKNNDLEKTTIIMFADHNTYYNNLSYHAKGIKERYNSELYRIPMMIYDQKLKAAYVENEGTNVISKFTTTSDLIPTIFDIFGIKGYKNLYFGNSMFTDVETVIFSRAYGIFVTDKLICYSANDIIYKASDYTQEDYESFLERSEILLEKMEYMDKIYYNDYFKTNPLKPIV